MDGFPVEFHPVPDGGQAVQGSGRESAFAGRAGIEQQVPAPAGSLRQRPDQFRRGFPLEVIFLVAPALVHAETDFPDALADEVAGNRGLSLRSGEVPAGNRSAQNLGQMEPALVQPVIDEQGRLQAAEVVKQRGAPVTGPGGFPFAVEPQGADFPVTGQKFLQLPLHISRVAVHVRGRVGGVAPPGGAVLVPVVRVGPVHQRIIEAEFQAVAEAGISQGAEHILAPRGGGHVPGGQGGIPEAEAVMVFGRDHDVFHPGLFGGQHPGLRVVVHRVELALQGGAVIPGRDAQAVLDPVRRAAGGRSIPGTARHGIDAPVDEHPEAGLLEPFQPGLNRRRGFLRFDGSRQATTGRGQQQR